MLYVSSFHKKHLCQSTKRIRGSTTITKLELYDCSHFLGKEVLAVLADEFYAKYVVYSVNVRRLLIMHLLRPGGGSHIDPNSTLQRLDLKWDGVYDDDVQNDWAPLFWL
jgi:hypothetical protein